MTRKDYIKFARMFNNVWLNLVKVYGSASCAGDFFETIVNKTADIMQADNPRFDRDRFFNAVYNKVEE